MKLRIFGYLFLVSVLILLMMAFIAGSILSAPYLGEVDLVSDKLHVEEISFEGAQGNELSGWYLEGRRELGGILLMHGIRANRLQMWERAKFLNKAGYSVLLFDSQGHGESLGDVVTFGYLESGDAVKAFNYLENKLSNKSIGVIGVSLGGVAALRGGVSQKADAIIIESVYPTIEAAVDNRIASKVGFLSKVTTPMLMWQMRLRLGFSPLELMPIEYVKNVKGALFVITGEKDLGTTVLESQQIFANANEPKDLWIVPDAAHVNFSKTNPIEYKEQILDFFDKYMRRSALSKCLDGYQKKAEGMKGSRGGEGGYRIENDVVQVNVGTGMLHGVWIDTSIDTKTFVDIKGAGYNSAMDKDHIYIGGCVYDDMKRDKFQELAYGYAKYDNEYYFRGNKLSYELCDNDIHRLRDSFTTDGCHLYLEGQQVLQNINVDKIKILSRDTFKDEERLYVVDYYGNWSNRGYDRENLVVAEEEKLIKLFSKGLGKEIGLGYRYVFEGGDIDLESFELVGSSTRHIKYFRDKNSLYRMDNGLQRLSRLDEISQKLKPIGSIFTDGENCYVDGFSRIFTYGDDWTSKFPEKPAEHDLKKVDCNSKKVRADMKGRRYIE